MKMDNNSILITVKIEYKDQLSDKIYDFELYVNKKITVRELVEGIQYGLLNQSENLPAGVKIIISNIRVSGSGSAEHTYLRLENVDGSCNYISYDSAETLQAQGFVTSSILFITNRYADEIKGKFLVSNPAYVKKNILPEYNITTRQIQLFDTTPIDIIPPSNPPSKQNRNLFEMLFPTILSVLVMMAARSFVSGGNNMSMMFLSGAMGITAVVTTTYSWNKQRKEYKKAIEDWRTHYQDYIARKIKEIQVRQKTDSDLLKEQYPDITEIIQNNGNGGKSIYSLNCDIYGYNENDHDFLTFRLGTSENIKNFFPINAAKKDVVYSDTTFQFSKKDGTVVISDDCTAGSPLFELPYTLSHEYRFLPAGTPLLYSLNHKIALGIVDPSDGEDRLKAAQLFITKLLLDLCFHHSPEKLQVVLFFEETTQEHAISQLIQPFQFLPHFRGLFEKKSQFVFNHKQANLVLNELRSIMDERTSNANNNSSLPRILMVLFNGYGIKEHSFASYLPSVPQKEQKNNQLGLHYICVSQYKEFLPAYCDDVINLQSDTTGTLTPYSNVAYIDKADRDITQFSFKSSVESSNKEITKASRFVSSLAIPKIAENAGIPSSIGMLEILSINYTQNNYNTEIKEAIIKNWTSSKRNDVTKTLSVPVGKNELDNVTLDLHEKADGPHMIVAGTTGSGKTETIISYLLALCTTYRPDEVNLLLVDMKGGGFVERLKTLPHVVGCVTDVSGDESGNGADYMLKRFLDSIKAEIKRRKKQFNQFKVDNIDDYIRKIRAANIRFTEAQITHLFIVIDEFTELKRYNSEHGDVDYISEITTIARIGRSLGLHIILISQNIEGAITEDIRVNVKSRLCLKVATRQASKEMIGNDLAARPNMPGNGRAYLLVGTGSRFEYFQSAYSGFDVEGEKKALPVILTYASRGGEYSCFYNSIYDNPRIKSSLISQDNRDKTQLGALVQNIKDVYDSDNEFIKPYIVFKNPMPEKMIYDSVKGYIDISQEETGK